MILALDLGDVGHPPPLHRKYVLALAQHALTVRPVPSGRRLCIVLRCTAGTLCSARLTKGKAAVTELVVDARCLMFFVDETGHEELSDPNYPVFGFGGCVIPAGAAEDQISRPWRALKAEHFGGAYVPLHAADLRKPSSTQLQALGNFFERQKFGRFGATVTSKALLGGGLRPYDVLPGALRKRWEELASRMQPTPTEVALLHEASERGDPLVERYFGPSFFTVNGKSMKVHHGLVPKSALEGLEVADFIAQAAGRQAWHRARGNAGWRKDFRAVFHANPIWSSLIDISSATLNLSQEDEQMNQGEVEKKAQELYEKIRDWIEWQPGWQPGNPKFPDAIKSDPTGIAISKAAHGALDITVEGPDQFRVRAPHESAKSMSEREMLDAVKRWLGFAAYPPGRG